MERKICILIFILLFISSLAFAETIHLKSGGTLEGKIIEKTDKYIKIDYYGVSITYYLDEIESIYDEKSVLTSISEEENSSKDALDFYKKKGIELALEGKFKEAQEYFKKALEVNKFDYSSQGALKMIDDLHKGIITEEYVLYCFKGTNFLRNKQYQQAITEFQKVLQVNPNYTLAYLSLGYAYQSLGQSQEAITYFQKALQIDPNCAEACYELGYAYYSLGQSQEAITYCQKALQIDPNFVAAYTRLGFLYAIFLNQYQEAITFFQKALQINPNCQDAHLGLGYIYHSLGQTQEAITYYQKALEINPNRAEAYVRLGNIYHSLGQTQEAITYYQKALEINPNRQDAHLGLGYIYRSLGQTQEAKENFQKAKELFQLKGKRYEKAVQQIAELLKELP